MDTPDSVPGAAILVDPDHRIVDGNVRTEIVFRNDLEEIQGTTLDALTDRGLLDDGALAKWKADVDSVLDGEVEEVSSGISFRPESGDKYDYDLRVFRPDDVDGDAVCCSFRSVGTRERYEETITALHVATRELVEARDIEDVLVGTAEAAHNVLGFPGTSVRRYDPETGMLEFVAFGAVVNKVEERPPYPVDDSPHGKAFRTGQTVIDSIDPGEDPYDRDDFTQTMYIPIGETGTLSVGTVGKPFNETDVQFAEILAENAASAIRVVDTTATLREQRERLDQFASIVSHDLRNPLNSAELYLELAMETGEQNHLERVADAHDRMNEMIENLLTMARIDAHDVDSEPVDLTALVNRTWGAVATPDATLQCALSPERTVHGDEDLLRHVFENLFLNAVEHTDTQVTVTVGSLADGQGIYVADDGEGLESGQEDTIFEYGYTTAEDGSGFGLTIVENVVDVHGWSIDVTDGGGGGARFEIRTGTGDGAD